MVADPSGLDRAGNRKSGMKPKLVTIEWRDIIAYSDWTPLSEIKIPKFKTIGYLIKKDREQVILAHTQDEKGEWFGFDVFPRGAVISITPITG